MSNSPNLRQQRGREGEEIAARALQEQGMEIVERNWHPPHGAELRGDIDILAREGNILCFIEVKARSNDERGAPQQAVTRAKQKQLSRLANAYVSLHQIDDVPCRFDVVEVWLGQSPRVVVHRNAFDYQE
ncbi:MAG TPA: YraN family protein [Abditibacteriaceae bacterium]|jgi:putative endonuclease